MNIDIIAIGKTDSAHVEALLKEYLRRINFHTKVNWVVLPDPKTAKNTTAELRKRLDGELLMKNFSEGDYVVLLDERGEQMHSMAYAQWLQKRLGSGVRRLCFVIGGPYGFTDEVYKRANGKLSLSKMTFSHQIVRALFAEQLYRAFTILRNEPYHHE